jgi:tetratricopeptide (TPR) repeat protein
MSEVTQRFGPDIVKRIANGTTPLNVFFGFSQEHIEAMAALGFNLYRQGKLRDAEIVFKGLAALDSTQYYGYAGLGAIALSDHRPAEAVTYLVRAVELNPNDATVHANLGEALLRQAQFDEAARHLDKALDLDPTEEDPGANRARAMIQGMEILISEFQRMDRPSLA